jgi:ABC-2 type transport system permease protein
MNKFLAVVRREYLPRVRTKGFVISTILGPLIMVGITVLPALVLMINAGEATRLAIVDQSGRMYEHVRESITRTPGREELQEMARENLNPTGMGVSQGQGRQIGEISRASFEFEQVSPAGRTLEDIKRELNERVRKDELDAYVIIPQDILASGKAEYYGSNVGDIISLGQIEERLSRAVIEQRMAEAKIDQKVVSEMSKPVRLTTVKISDKGEEESARGGFYLVLGIGIFILLMVTMYGQLILGAVIEEKETRVSEILFSSIRAFSLMMGKLVGVSLIALTQLFVWALVMGLFTVYGASALAGQGMDIALPHISPAVMVYCFLFTLLGYFIYATIYVLIGAMVTTTQEAGQVALPVVFLLVAGYLLMFPVIRDPDSTFAFWVSMFPFFSPIIMPVRIVTQTPSFWEIMLSLFIGVFTVVLLTWLASRIYRIGMLMYGKRATIPEVWRWLRQT